MSAAKLTTKDLMVKYDKTTVTIYNWVKAGLPHKMIQDGRKTIYQFDEKEVEQWINSQRGN